MKQCLMWMRSNFPSPINSFISPWEDQNPPAFHDHQKPFGGFIWPPRSYTCTFCRREFRSAQALGGHMNVHRRDRARLKQSSPPQQDESAVILRHQKQIYAQENGRRSGKPGFRDNECNNQEDFVETKLSMGIDLVDRGNNVICKRHKKGSSTVSSPLPFLHSKLCSSSMEDIDLELRLGDPPAVK